MNVTWVTLTDGFRGEKEVTWGQSSVDNIPVGVAVGNHNEDSENTRKGRSKDGSIRILVAKFIDLPSD